MFIELHRTCGTKILVNLNHVSVIEPCISGPGATLTLCNGDWYFNVKEPYEEIKTALMYDQLLLYGNGPESAHSSVL